MLEKWELAADNKRDFSTLLIDLSKVFDCLSNDLLLAKLNAFGFSLLALRLVKSYLSNRKQRTTINKNSVYGQKFCLGYLKDKFSDLFFNIVNVICFS